MCFFRHLVSWFKQKHQFEWMMGKLLLYISTFPMYRADDLNWIGIFAIWNPTIQNLSKFLEFLRSDWMSKTILEKIQNLISIWNLIWLCTKNIFNQNLIFFLDTIGKFWYVLQLEVVRNFFKELSAWLKIFLLDDKIELQLIWSEH